MLCIGEKLGVRYNLLNFILNRTTMETGPLKADRSYRIEYKKGFYGLFKRTKHFDLKVENCEFDSYPQNSNLGSDVKSHLHFFGIHVEEILGYNFIKMHEWRHTGSINLYVYLVNDGLKIFRALKIMDMCIKDKFQSLGIGSQVLRLIEEISKKNSVKCIYGVLEKNGDLERRKNFYFNNGFRIEENPVFGFSNICAVKFVNSSN